MSIAKQVAYGLAKASKSLGQSFNIAKPQSISTRAQNLLALGYVVDGDPHGWAGGRALATVYMEQRGGSNDCLTLDYWAGGSFDTCAKADEGQDWFIEFTNGGVASVWPA